MQFGRSPPHAIIAAVIARAVRLAQATSSTTSVVLLIAFNLVPLIGVLAWGWNVATLLVLYWVENGIVGVLNVPKMLLAQGPGRTGLGVVKLTVDGPISRVGQVLFFLVHYGMFWLVHGVFVFALPTFAGLGGVDAGTVIDPRFDPGFGPVFVDVAGDPLRRPTGPDMTAVAWGALGLAISRGASFVVNFLGRREYLRVSAAEQMFAPYGRLLILHLTIILGAFLSLSLGSPIGAIVVLVLIKTIVDLGFHVREHAAVATRPATA
jgi:hypothetical protein